MTERDDILDTALAWLDEGRGVALATVIATRGSSPRPVGSQLVINDRGRFAGSVSGGCVESFVVSEAIDVIAEGGVLNLDYGSGGGQAQQVRLACGGAMVVFVERAPRREVLEKLRRGKPAGRVVDTASGKSALVGPDGVEGDLVLDDGTLSQARRIIERGVSGGIGGLFVKVYARPACLVVVGAVHIAQDLAAMAGAVGFRVRVIDPRPNFATPERLPGVEIITARPQTAIGDIALDSRTAVVALAHDPLLDDPVLIAALNSSAFYIGCLGSRKTHAARLQRLRSQGFGEDQLRRLHGPVGLDIGGRSPGEIAVSILAQIVAVGNGRKTP